jgi:hypothetical protein
MKVRCSRGLWGVQVERGISNLGRQMILGVGWNGGCGSMLGLGGLGGIEEGGKTREKKDGMT